MKSLKSLSPGASWEIGYPVRQPNEISLKTILDLRSIELQYYLDLTVPLGTINPIGLLTKNITSIIPLPIHFDTKLILCFISLYMYWTNKQFYKKTSGCRQKM